MNRSELQDALIGGAERAERMMQWNYDHIETKALEAVAHSLRAVADLLEEGVSNEAR